MENKKIETGLFVSLKQKDLDVKKYLDILKFYMTIKPVNNIGVFPSNKTLLHEAVINQQKEIFEFNEANSLLIEAEADMPDSELIGARVDEVLGEYSENQSRKTLYQFFHHNFCECQLYKGCS
jgi:hypothetical protein